MKKLIMIAAAAMLALNVAAEDKKEAPKKGGRGNILKELGLSKEQAAKMSDVWLHEVLRFLRQAGA